MLDDPSGRLDAVRTGESRRPHPRHLEAQGGKNGARSPICRAGRGWRRLEFADVKPGPSLACDRGPTAANTAKWRFRPLIMRHSAPVSASFLPIFSRFFCEPGHQGANRRECDSPMPILWATRLTALLTEFVPRTRAGSPLRLIDAGGGFAIVVRASSRCESGIQLALVPNLQLQDRAIIGSNIGKVVTSLLPYASSAFRSVVVLPERSDLRPWSGARALLAPIERRYPGGPRTWTRVGGFKGALSLIAKGFARLMQHKSVAARGARR